MKSMKFTLPFIIMVTLFALPLMAMSDNPQDTVSFTKNYKVTVEVETPEGLKIGSAVRQISNSKSKNSLGWPDVGNPADVIGEAVVVDLDERGVLFALINKDAEAARFYNAFPAPEGAGNTTVAAIQHYGSLQLGESAVLDQKLWPMFVTFTDIDDPKSVTLVWGNEFNPKTQKHEPVNRIEEVFGKGVTLNNIRLKITDEPVKWGVVDKFLPKYFQTKIIDEWTNLPVEDRRRMGKLTTFKIGRPTK